LTGGIFIVSFSSSLFFASHLDVLFHFLVAGEVQLIVVLALDEITIGMTVSPADPGPLVINPAAIIFLREVPALVLDVEIPVALLDEDRDILMA
jgi:hypothetical protein